MKVLLNLIAEGQKTLFKTKDAFSMDMSRFNFSFIPREQNYLGKHININNRKHRRIGANLGTCRFADFRWRTYNNGRYIEADV